MRRPSSRLAALLATALAGACAAERDGVRDERPIASRVDTWQWFVPPNPELDILFVIDNSASMADEQAALAAAFPVFMNALESVRDGMPDVHIGVVSSDVGAAGQRGVPGCGRAGDDGELLVPPACSGLADAFIADRSDERGGRIRNYTGELGDLFACMAQLGTGGCGFEMPLEAMYRAVQPGRNPGFLRPQAYLAVIFVTDEDDCSTDVGAMFGAPDAGPTSPLGPYSSFRCFEFGVECDGATDPRAFGTHTGCRPRADSPYMIEVETYVSFMKHLKADPSLVIVSGIIGVDDEAHTVVVGPDPADPTRPAVHKSCSRVDPADPHDGATPPIRLESFLRSFSNRNARSSICGETMEDALRGLVERVGPAFGDPCLHRPLADVDPVRPGVQPQCSVTVKSFRPSAGLGDETVLPPCEARGDETACWELLPSPRRCPVEVGEQYLNVLPEGPDGVRGLFKAQCLLQ